jgi:hypothetical protein
MRVGPALTSENGITFAVGKALPARGKLTLTSLVCDAKNTGAIGRKSTHCK